MEIYTFKELVLIEKFNKMTLQTVTVKIVFIGTRYCTIWYKILVIYNLADNILTKAFVILHSLYWYCQYYGTVWYNFNTSNCTDLAGENLANQCWFKTSIQIDPKRFQQQVATEL